MPRVLGPQRRSRTNRQRRSGPSGRESADARRRSRRGAPRRPMRRARAPPCVRDSRHRGRRPWVILRDRSGIGGEVLVARSDVEPGFVEPAIHRACRDHHERAEFARDRRERLGVVGSEGDAVENESVPATAVRTAPASSRWRAIECTSRTSLGCPSRWAAVTSPSWCSSVRAVAVPMWPVPPRRTALFCIG